MDPLARFADLTRPLSLDEAYQALSPTLEEMLPGQPLPSIRPHGENRRRLELNGNLSQVSILADGGNDALGRAALLVALARSVGELLAVRGSLLEDIGEILGPDAFFRDPRNMLIAQSVPGANDAWTRHFHWTRIRAVGEELRFAVSLVGIAASQLPLGLQVMAAVLLGRELQPSATTPVLMPTFLLACPYGAPSEHGTKEFPKFLQRIGNSPDPSERLERDLLLMRQEIFRRLGHEIDLAGLERHHGGERLVEAERPEEEGDPAEKRKRAWKESIDLARIFRVDKRNPTQFRALSLETAAAARRHPAWAIKDGPPLAFLAELKDGPRPPTPTQVRLCCELMFHPSNDPPPAWIKDRALLEELDAPKRKA